MSAESRLLDVAAQELVEEAPCGFLSTLPDGTIIQVNHTFELWTGHSRADLLEKVRLQDLLSPGARIYHETHYSPLLQMQGSVREIAVEIMRADGSPLSALMNSSLKRDADGVPRLILTTVFDATDRRRYEQELLRNRQLEHEIAQQLQRSLLAGDLPSSAALEFDVAYSAAVRGTEVGGDWYDAFWLVDDKTVALAVGDVVGRGILAAATMGQLRSALRAFAAGGAGPAAVLRGLDAFSARHHIGQMTTLVYAELEIASGTLSYACAGHPPPLILDGSGACAPVWGGRSLPINALPQLDPRPQAQLALERGSTLVLYTDGLIENPRRPDENGIERLCAELCRRAAATPAGLADPVVRDLADREGGDDVCMLTVRLR